MCSPIAAFRLAWRLSSVTPHLPESLRAYQRYPARITHVALYSLLFLYPLSGWAALSAYEDERRPATAKIVLANRQNGPEQVMQRVEELAPGGFRHIEDVLTAEELKETAANYKKLAGFDKEALNSRASIVQVAAAS